MNWWSKEANRTKYPTIYSLAIRILALPSPNSFQERAFTSGRFYDHYKRQRMGDKKFEIATLLNHNKKFIQENVAYLEQCSQPGEESSSGLQDLCRFFAKSA